MTIGEIYHLMLDHEFLIQTDEGLMLNLRKLVQAKKDAEKNAVKKVSSPLRNPSPSKKYIVSVNSKQVTDTSNKEKVTSTFDPSIESKGISNKNNEPYLSDNSLGKNAKKTAVASLANEVINTYNKYFDKKVKSSKSWINNLVYWAEVYSKEDILEAIRISSFHEFWNDKMKLTILFRTKNPQAEPVDWIGDMLNYVPTKPPSKRDKWIEKFLRENPDLDKSVAEELCPYPVE